MNTLKIKRTDVEPQEFYYFPLDTLKDDFMSPFNRDTKTTWEWDSAILVK